MKGYIFAMKYFTSKDAMLDFVNDKDHIEVVSVIPEGGGHYTLFYFW